MRLLHGTICPAAYGIVRDWRHSSRTVDSSDRDDAQDCCDLQRAAAQVFPICAPIHAQLMIPGYIPGLPASNANCALRRAFMHGMPLREVGSDRCYAAALGYVELMDPDAAGCDVATAAVEFLAMRCKNRRLQSCTFGCKENHLRATMIAWCHHRSPLAVIVDLGTTACVFCDRRAQMQKMQT